MPETHESLLDSGAMGGLFNHPSKELLVSFSSGKLSSTEASLIAAHVEGCVSCATIVRMLPDGPLGDRPEVAATAIANPAAPSPPLELLHHPRYRVLRFIGWGGMGAVYEAEHLLLQRRVAFKVVRSNLLERPEVVERFHREMHAAGKLSHPNVVAALDAEQAGNLHFLVTEFIEGATLHEVVECTGPLSFAVACDYIHQAALGLQHALEMGMVHRDIHPRNLMLSGNGVVKILDFGLARFVAETESEVALTGANVVLGTPDYVAPEQVRDARHADIRADIYSLGCTLYFLLAGHSPFPRGSTMEKVLDHLTRTPTPLRETRRDIPPELESVVERMMAKVPDERFQTPADAARALKPFLGTGARPDGAIAVRSPRSKAKQRRRMIAGAVVLAAMVLGLGAAVFFAFWSDSGSGPMPPGRVGKSGSEATAGDRRPIGVLTGHKDMVRCVAWSPDGQCVASGGYDREVRLRKWPGGQPEGLFAHHEPLYFLAFSPNGDRLAFGSGHGFVVADPKAGRVLREFKMPGCRFSAVVFLPGSSSRLLSAGQEGVVREWDVESDRPLREFHTPPLTFVTFSPDARTMLFSSGGLKAPFWDVNDGKTLWSLAGHTGPVRCVALSSQARRALTGGDDETVRLWDLNTGKELHRFTGHTGAVRSVAFSSNGAQAISGGDDRTLRLWDVARGSELLRMVGHRGAVWCVAFSPDGRHAVSGGADGAVYLWDLRPHAGRRRED